MSSLYSNKELIGLIALFVGIGSGVLAMHLFPGEYRIRWMGGYEIKQKFVITFGFIAGILAVELVRRIIMALFH